MTEELLSKTASSPCRNAACKGDGTTTNGPGTLCRFCRVWIDGYNTAVEKLARELGLFKIIRDARDL